MNGGDVGVGEGWEAWTVGVDVAAAGVAVAGGVASAADVAVAVARPWAVCVSACRVSKGTGGLKVGPDRHAGRTRTIATNETVIKRWNLLE